ncbi:hypothetical protein CB0940_01078 [Cercospora beticola]|uniref:FIST domain-containing protein n=2 Tax=Cercospora beticola TaxID=122368 RepID=A0A2G5IB41_CERBT|nr:hypothetical protein CB0940_01078 [Cercospora beticola]PIB01754.1 hypothetical protein CB0940_01078 [Cercospora beticola]
MLLSPTITRPTRAATWRALVQHPRHSPRRCLSAAVRLQQSTASGLPHPHPSTSHGVFMGTVAAPSSQETSIDEIIAKIEPAARGKPVQVSATPSLLSLLVSSSFARHALDPNFPLKVLQRFSANPTASKPLDAVVAVVDRLPAPGGPPSGVEGIAYALVTDPLQSLLEAQTPLQSSTTKPGSMSFAMRHGDSCRVDAQLPLAQTIFTTGMPSTLLHIRYQFDPLSGQLRKQASQRLESAHISLPDTLGQGNIKLQAQLLPLTVPRQVVSSMGNIVRKLAAPESGSKIISASQELEAAVSSYFASKQKAPEAVQVWALILPPELGDPRAAAEALSTALQRLDSKSIEGIWAADGSRGLMSSSPRDDLLPTLVSGARLCRVLSGGGGWGKKAGLLSLDPDSQYSTRELRRDQGWDFTFDGDSAEEMLASGRKQALGEVTREGESIVFFLVTPSEWETGSNADLVDDVRHKEPGDIVFGALPASVESDQTSERTSQVTHHNWRFGALSEGGLALTIAKDGTPVTRTKADIPYARLNISGTG